MQDTLSNKLASFLGTLSVADQPEYLAIWQGKTPLDFTTELAEVRLDVTALASDGAVQSAPITGSTEALRTLRDTLERRLHVLARATYKALKKTGNLEDAAKANLTPSKLHDARAVALAGLSETVLDLAEPLTIPPAVGQPAPGESGGITAAFVAEVDNLWDQYSVAVGAPTGARSKRKALTAALPQRFRDTEEKFSDLDDLVIQFGGTAIGAQFVAAWFNARHVTDLGRRSAKPKDVKTSSPSGVL